MKVEDKREYGKCVTIKDLKSGDVFEYGDEVFIVTVKKYDDRVTCVCVSTGMFCDFLCSALVTLINAKVVIE